MIAPGAEVTYSIGGSTIWRGTVLSREEAIAIRGLSQEEATAYENKYREYIWVRVTHNFTRKDSVWNAIAYAGRVDSVDESALEIVSALTALAEAAE